MKVIGDTNFCGSVATIGKRKILLQRVSLATANSAPPTASPTTTYLSPLTTVLILRLKNAADVFRDRYRAHLNDVSILVRNEGIGVPIVKHFCDGRGFRVTHVFDLSGQGKYRKRRQEKWRFQPNAGSLKICTIHSFKGWEAPFVQVVID